MASFQLLIASFQAFLSIPLDKLKEMTEIVKNFSPDPDKAETPINSFSKLFNLDVSVVRSLYAYICHFGSDKVEGLAANAHGSSGPQDVSSRATTLVPDGNRDWAHLPTPAPSEPPPEGLLSLQTSPSSFEDQKIPNILDGIPPLQYIPPPTPVSPSNFYFLPAPLAVSQDSTAHPQVEERQEDEDMEQPSDEEEGLPTDLQGFLSRISKHEDWMDDLLHSL